MATWCVANQKGGVGKTTTAAALAFELAERGRRVVVIDLDPHASLSWWFGVSEASPSGAFDLFGDAPPPVSSLMLATAAGRVSIIPAQPALATVERRCAARPGAARVFGAALRDVATSHDVIIDCPPTIGVVTIGALAAADVAVVPTLAEPLSSNGTRATRATIAMVERARARTLPTCVVPTLVDRRTRIARDTIDALRATGDAAVWHDEIPVDTRIRDLACADANAAVAFRATRAGAAYARLTEWLLCAVRSSPMESAA